MNQSTRLRTLKTKTFSCRLRALSLVIAALGIPFAGNSQAGTIIDPGFNLFETVTVQRWFDYRRHSIAPMQKEQTMMMMLFAMLGSSVQLGALVDLSDALVFIVAIPNLLGLYLLAPLIRKELKDYETNHR